MTHAELLARAFEDPGVCYGSVARLGRYVDAESTRKPLPVVTIYHCPRCDRAVEMLEDHTRGAVQISALLTSYVYTLASLPRPRRRRP